MAWVFFQVFLAFGVGVAIVWWTWPKSTKNALKPTPPKPPPPKPDDVSASD